LNDNRRVPLYVINNFLKFERKLYQVFGLPLHRPIKLKAVLYAIVIGVVELVIYFTPVIGSLINWMPFGVLLAIPIGSAWLLADVGTEDRLPVSYFKSFFSYQIRKLKGDGVFRGRIVQKEGKYQFANYVTFHEVDDVLTKEEIKQYENSLNEERKAERYFNRITRPDEFFKREQNKKKKRSILSIFTRKG